MSKIEGCRPPAIVLTPEQVASHQIPRDAVVVVLSEDAKSAVESANDREGRTAVFVGSDVAAAQEMADELFVASR